VPSVQRAADQIGWAAEEMVPTATQYSFDDDTGPSLVSVITAVRVPALTALALLTNTPLGSTTR